MAKFSLLLPCLLALSTIARATCLPDASEPDDACIKSAAVAKGGVSLALNFCDDPGDYLRFNACSGREYTIATSSLGSAADTVVDLYGPDCVTLLASDDNGGGGAASLLDWTAPADGVYHVKIRQANGTSGDGRGYSLDLTGDTSTCATWSKEYISAAGGDIRSAHETSSGAFIASGWRADGAGDYYAWLGMLSPAGAIVWQKALRFPVASETAFAVEAVEAADGAFVLAGHGLPPGTTGNNLFLAKVDASGVLQWLKHYPTSGSDNPESLSPTADGGFVVAGFTNAFETGATGDGWVLKLNGAGVVEWSRRYGGPSHDWATFVRPTADGGYLVAGVTYVTLDGPSDAWVMKLDAAGAVLWNRTYGGPDWDYADSLAPMPDGGAVVAGTMYSPAFGELLWLFRVDAAGSVVWQETLGTNEVGGPHVVSTRESGLVVACSDSNGGPTPAGLLIGIDGAGAPQWRRRYGDTGVNAGFYAAEETADGGFGIISAPETGSSLMIRTDSGALVEGCSLLSPTPLPTPVVTAAAVTDAPGFHSVDLAVTPVAVTGTLEATADTPSSECLACEAMPFLNTLRVDKSSDPAFTRLDWTSTAQGPLADIVRGDLAALRSTGGDFTAAHEALPAGLVCPVDNSYPFGHDDFEFPAAGNGYFYVLRPVRRCAGSYDSGSPRQVASRDLEVANADGRCP